MFTGIIEGTGTVAALNRIGPSVDLVIAPPISMQTDDRLPRIGDSVAINGCCLTVVDITNVGWKFQAGEETLSRTNLGGLMLGDVVNLERALRVGDALGGHFVQGHVDDLGYVLQIDRDDEWV